MRALFDSNVLIARLDMEHIHYGDSRTAFENTPSPSIVMSAHSLAEIYNRLTRDTRRPVVFTPERTALAIRQIVDEVDVIALTAQQTGAAIAAFAARQGTGARLYDYLIGHVAIVHDIPAIVTWNTKHMAPLFPGLRVVTPAEFAKEP